VRDRPQEYLRQFGIAIVDQTLEQFPNSHEYFPSQLNRELYSAVSWHLEVAPRDHDATVLTLIMRRRGTNQSHDVFQTKHLFITKSGYLSQLARRFCIDNGLILENQVPPAIHQRQLATTTWLRTGLGATQEVPKRYLLAACERVLELKRGIVEKARHVVAKLSAEQQEQLELLLTEDRSVQVMMDKTLGSSAVISERNMSELIDAMKQSLVVDIERQKRAEVATIRQKAADRIHEADEARRAAETRVAAIEDQLSSARTIDRDLINGVIVVANRRVRRYRGIVNAGASLFLFALFALPIAAELVTGIGKYVLLGVGGALSVLLGYMQIWDRETGLQRLVQRYAQRAVNKLVAERGLQSKVADHRVVFTGAEFEFDRALADPSVRLALE
jgi:hypothetical protein